MTLNLLTALLLACSGFTLGVRQIMLSPRNETFPCAPQSVRVAMFAMAGALLFLAILFFGKGETPYAAQAAVPVAVLAGIGAFYNLVMLLNVVNQRYPARVWRRLNRVMRTAADSGEKLQLVSGGPRHAA